MKYVRVRYRGPHGRIYEEVNILVEQGDVYNIEGMPPMVIPVSMLQQPGYILLEDECGMWGLEQECLVSMLPATQGEFEEYCLKQRQLRDSHRWN